MTDPVKGRTEPEEGCRYKARCAPAVAMRAGCGTEIPVVRGLGWGRKAQLTLNGLRKRPVEMGA